MNKDVSGAYCAASGLNLGGCHMRRTRDSAYCYYHDKRQTGVIDFSQRQRVVEETIWVAEPEAKNYEVVSRDPVSGMVAIKVYYTVWAEIDDREVYPVWPLPKKGYPTLERVA